MYKFINGTQCCNTFELWKQAQKQRTRDQSENLLITEYDKLFDRCIMLDSDMQRLQLQIDKLTHENEFMLKLINDHMIGE